MEINYRAHIEQINKQIKELLGIYREAVKRLDISESEFWVWYTLVTMEGDFTQQDICALWSLPKQTVNTAIAHMRLRRYATLGSRPVEGAGELTIGGITLNDRTKTVTVEGEAVNLTPTEYSILHLLMDNPGKVYSTKALYEAVWQEAALGSEGAVAVHIRHLREKIEINPSEPRYLKVVWGQGYKMEGGR
jgi:hypothetical protein